MATMGNLPIHKISTTVRKMFTTSELASASPKLSNIPGKHWSLKALSQIVKVFLYKMPFPYILVLFKKFKILAGAGAQWALREEPRVFMQTRLPIPTAIVICTILS